MSKDNSNMKILKIFFSLFFSLMLTTMPSCNPSEKGEKILIVEIQGENMGRNNDNTSEISVIRRALETGGQLTLDVEALRQIDPKFDSNYAVSGSDGKFLVKPAILNFVGGQGWRLLQIFGLPGNTQYVFVKNRKKDVSIVRLSETATGNELFSDKEPSSKVSSEDFATFIKAFVSDKKFQLERIKFPLNSIQSKDEWDFLDSDIIFEGVKTMEGSKLSGVFLKVSEDEYQYEIGYVESDLIFSITFKKINGQWMLTEFVDILEELKELEG